MTIPARDGYALAATLFASPTPRALVQINSATGVPRQFYRHFARWLSSRQIAVVTYDYRGVGESLRVPISEFQGHVREWGELDAAGVADWCASSYPGLPVVALGHSIGGQLIGLCNNNQLYARVVGVAAQSGYWRLWPEGEREKRRRLWTDILPAGVARDGYFAGRAVGGADLPGSIALSWARWCLSPDYIVDDDGSPLRAHFEALLAPMRFIRFTDDEIAPAEPVAALMGFYANAPKRLEVIDPADHGLTSIGHFDFFRPGCAALWPLAAGWLEGAEPSSVLASPPAI